ncbi:MAG: MAPEG family protein [Deltaproteobacteria bacterium]|nr:MAPEG family protein [Deltaproteobacteria bacterium]
MPIPLPITALYLALFCVFACCLAIAAGRIRGSDGISVGDGGRTDLLIAMRRHANFVEYVPYFMIMFAVLELNGGSALLLHGLGLGMLAARICHAAGLGEEVTALRGVGAGLTFLLSLIAAGVLGYQFVQA